MVRFALALAAALMALPAIAADTLPPPGGKSLPVPQATIMARTHPSLATCGPLQEAYLSAGWPRGAGIDTIRQIDSLVRRSMILRGDSGADTWTPLSAALVAGHRVTGDCEDMSITNAHLAICAGMPPDRVGLLITTNPDGANGELHMLAFYKDPSDRTWVFGDTFGRPRALSRVTERLIFMAYMQDVTRWYGLLGRIDPPEGTSGLPATSAIPAGPETEPRVGTCRVDQGTAGH